MLVLEIFSILITVLLFKACTFENIVPFLYYDLIFDTEKFLQNPDSIGIFQSIVVALMLRLEAMMDYWRSEKLNAIFKNVCYSISNHLVILALIILCTYLFAFSTALASNSFYINIWNALRMILCVPLFWYFAKSFYYISYMIFFLANTGFRYIFNFFKIKNR